MHGTVYSETFVLQWSTRDTANLFGFFELHCDCLVNMGFQIFLYVFCLAVVEVFLYRCETQVGVLYLRFSV